MTTADPADAPVRTVGGVGMGVQRVALGATHLLAAVAGIVADIPALWRDEVVAYEMVANHSAAELLLTWPTFPPHFPTWFVLADLLGVNAAVWLSKLSLLALVWPTYRLGRHLAGERAGYYAAVAVAASPFLAAQATWLRMYGLLTAAMVWGLYLGRTRRYRRAAGCFGVASVLHPFGVFGVAWLALATDALADRRTRWLAVAAGGPAGGAAAYILARNGWGAAGGVYHGIAPDALRVALTPAAALVGAPHTAAPVALLLVGTALLVTVPLDRQLAAWVGLPLATVVAYSHLVHPIYRVKYFGFVAPAVAVMLVSDREGRYRRAAAAACFVAAAIVVWYQRVTVPSIVARRFLFWW